MICSLVRRELEARHYPELQEVVFGAFAAQFEACLGERALVLDSGSGPGTWVVAEHRDRVRLWVGEDVYRPNTHQMDAFVLGPCENLPFADGVFDVVVSYFVLEHLPAPQAALREYARVLKRGGHLCFKTPAVRSPLFALSRILSTTMHKRLKSGIGTAERDVFPTYYRANTLGKLEHHLANAGFRRVWLRTVDQTYAYLSQTRLTYALGLLYSRLTGLPALAFLRNQIIGIYRAQGEDA